MSVKDIFETMDYGPAPESAADALAWLVDQGASFGHFINGEFTAPGDGFDSRNPATGEQFEKEADKVVKMTIAKALKDSVNG